MAQRWMNVADAASRLDVSPRTIERRIQKGELETRRTDDGREVLVDIPDQPSDIVSDSLTVITEHDQHQIELAKRLADAYETPIQRAHDEVERVRSEVSSVRRNASVAWLTAVGMAAITVAAGYWALNQQGRAGVATEQAQNAAQAASDSRQAVVEIKSMLRSSEDRAIQAAAQAQQWAAKAEATATEAKEATARAHDLELQMTKLQAETERNRLVAAASSGAGEVKSEPEMTSMARGAGVD